MATAAPSTAPGSGLGEAGADATVRAPDTGHENLPDPAKVRKGLAAKPIKPIKTKVQLPGVDTGFDARSPFDAKIAKALGRDPESGDGLDSGDGPQFGEKSARVEGDQGKQPQAARGPDGKFLKAEGEEQVQEQEQEAAPDEQPADAPEPHEEQDTLEVLAPKYKELDQKHKTLQGMFKPLQTKLTDTLHHQRKAAESAVSWKARADSLEREVATLKSGGHGSAAPSPAGGVNGRAHETAGEAPGAEGRVQHILKSVDWDMYKAVKAQGDDAAAVFLIEQALNLSDRSRKQDIEALRQEVEPLIERTRAEDHNRQVSTHAVDVFMAVADIKNQATGEHMFPELHDEQLATAVTQHWIDSGEDPNRMLTPRGVVQAILDYRFYYGDPTPPARPAAESVEEQEETEDDESRPDQTHLNARAIRSQLAAHGNTSPAPGSSKAQPRDPASIIKHALRNTVDRDVEFGFPTRKRK